MSTAGGKEKHSKQKQKEMNKQKKHMPTKVIVDESDVPEGFIKLTAFKELIGFEKYRLLGKIYQSQGIPSCKLMRTTNDRTGPVFVHETIALEVMGKICQVEEKKDPLDRLISTPSDKVTSSKTNEPEVVELLEKLVRQNAEIIGALGAMLKIWKGGAE